MYEDSAQAQSVNPHVPFFQRITANFVPLTPTAGYAQEQFCGDEVADNSQAGDGI